MAAGQGFKTFITGEVLTAGDVNGYLMQGINVFATTTARNAAITAPAEGQFAFTKDTNSLWYYDGAAWVASGAAGDIEGVTAGVGISGGGTSGTVTVTNSMATAIDAKGDLVPGTGADTFARLAVGSNGTVLTADSAEATGLKWAAAASGGWTLITSGTLSGTSTAVSSISGAYTDLKILFIGMVPSSAGASISITYNNTDGVYNPGIVFTDGSDTFDAASNAATANKIGNNMATTGTTNSVQILMQDYSRSTGYKRAMMTGWNARNGGNSHWFWYQQRAAISGAINRFDVTTSAGTLSGSYFVYGI